MFADIVKVFILFLYWLPQTTINKAINVLRKRLNACVRPMVDILSILC